MSKNKILDRPRSEAAHRELSRFSRLPTPGLVASQLIHTIHERPCAVLFAKNDDISDGACAYANRTSKSIAIYRISLTLCLWANIPDHLGTKLADCKIRRIEFGEKKTCRGKEPMVFSLECLALTERNLGVDSKLIRILTSLTQHIWSLTHKTFQKIESETRECLSTALLCKGHSSPGWKNLYTRLQRFV